MSQPMTPLAASSTSFPEGWMLFHPNVLVQGLTSLALLVLAVSWSLLLHLTAYLQTMVFWLLARTEQWKANFEERLQSHFQDYEQHPPRGGSFMNLPRGRMFYHLQGRPHLPCVVLIPDLISSCQAWSPIAQQLVQQGYAVLTFDFHGTGHSDDLKSNREISLDSYADQMVALVDALGWTKPFALCGYGVGALVACQVSADHPERVSKLILLSPGACPSSTSFVGWPLLAYRRLLHSSSAGLALMDGTQHLMLLSSSFFVPWLRRQLQSLSSTASLPLVLRQYPWAKQAWARFKTQLKTWDRHFYQRQQWLDAISVQLRYTPHFKQHLFQLLLQFPCHQPLPTSLWESLSIHPQKLLLIWGQEDTWNPITELQEWTGRLPHAKVYRVTEGGYGSLFFQTAAISHVMQSFLANQEISL